MFRVGFYKANRMSAGMSENASASGASAAVLADDELPVVTCYTADISICSMICRLAAVEHKVPRLVHRNVDIECAMEVRSKHHCPSTCLRPETCPYTHAPTDAHTHT